MKRHLLLACALILLAMGHDPGQAAAATVSVDIHIASQPQLVVIPSLPVYQAPSLPYNCFFYRGQYYLFHDGRWFFAPGYNGPWHVIAVEYVPVPVLRVPVQYYKAPPKHWKERKGPPPWAPAWGHRKKEQDRD